MPLWNWVNCYLSGRHDYGMWCEPGAIFLRCVHCGKRSSGWSVAKAAGTPPVASVARKASPVPAGSAAAVGHVVPFERRATAR